MQLGGASAQVKAETIEVATEVASGVAVVHKPAADTMGQKSKEGKFAAEAGTATSLTTYKSVAETESLDLKVNGAVEAPIVYEPVAETVSLNVLRLRKKWWTWYRSFARSAHRSAPSN